jgi:hypothetical protein
LPLRCERSASDEITGAANQAGDQSWEVCNVAEAADLMVGPCRRAVGAIAPDSALGRWCCGELFLVRNALAATTAWTAAAAAAPDSAVASAAVFAAFGHLGRGIRQLGSDGL